MFMLGCSRQQGRGLFGKGQIFQRAVRPLNQSRAGRKAIT